MKKRTTTIADQAKDARRAERRYRAENDPWFGKRRRAGEHAGPTKAKASREACRGKGRASWD